MELTLKRTFKGPDYTIGKLSIDGVFFSNTLEDTDRNLSSTLPLQEITRIKVYGKTAIPTGTYKIDMKTVSPKFKDRVWALPYQGKLPRLLDVKGYEGVLIHVLNTAEESFGCIGVGTYNGGDRIVNSTVTFHNLMKKLLPAVSNNEPITITIE